VSLKVRAMFERWGVKDLEEEEMWVEGREEVDIN
jgi:hypothetical protein